MKPVNPHISIDRDEVSAFCRQHHITRLALFGSVLGDDFGPYSDVDVLWSFRPAMFLASTSSASSESSLDCCKAGASIW
jgi:predicted nucleotidyltransferase